MASRTALETYFNNIRFLRKTVFVKENDVTSAFAALNRYEPISNLQNFDALCFSFHFFAIPSSIPSLLLIHLIMSM